MLKECAALLENSQVDVIYARYHGGDPIFARFAKKYGKKIITEHQTLETIEMRITSKYLKWFSEIFFGPKILRSVTAIVGVTAEICNYEVKRSGNKIKFYLVNGNGIDVSSVPLRNAPSFDGKTLDLLCVAHVAKWHGLDRLIKGITNYNGETEIKFHIIGEGTEIKKLKSLVSILKLEKYVIFHGFKTGKELDRFFDRCHIAVGSLGLHRISLRSSSILKVREYCARGIPFIIASTDLDFPDDFPYMMRVPANDEPVNIKELIDFFDSIKDENYIEEMRNYARNKLDWTAKMKPVIDKLLSLVSYDETSKQL